VVAGNGDTAAIGTSATPDVALGDEMRHIRADDDDQRRIPRPTRAASARATMPLAASCDEPLAALAADHDDRGDLHGAGHGTTVWVHPALFEPGLTHRNVSVHRDSPDRSTVRAFGPMRRPILAGIAPLAWPP
jgi:hypothetical protein